MPVLTPIEEQEYAEGLKEKSLSDLSSMLKGELDRALLQKYLSAHDIKCRLIYSELRSRGQVEEYQKIWDEWNWERQC